jgi:hypothetical protein
VGRDVRTEGVVRRFADPSGPYFVLEDAEDNRVELSPASRVTGYQGRRVEVVGVFCFNQKRGRFIDVANVSIVTGRRKHWPQGPLVPVDAAQKVPSPCALLGSGVGQDAGRRSPGVLEATDQQTCSSSG